MLTGDILRLSADRHPDRTALICGDDRISYGGLSAAANQFGNALLGNGVSKGGTWAIMSRNLPEYVMAHFGSAQTGAMVVNLLPAYASDELVAILKKTSASLIVVEEIFQQKIVDILDQVPALQSVIVIGQPLKDSWVSFEQFISGQPATACRTDISDDDPFAMTFTGGTTGLPKGCLVSHRARFVSCYTTAIEHGVSESDTVATVTPFYHAMGSLVWLPTAIFAGATLVIVTGWDPDDFVELTARHKITCTFMVPIQLRQILSDEHFDRDKLKSLTKVSCGGAITPADLVHEIKAKMPDTQFTNHYGQSETGPICFYHPTHPRNKANTVGHPALGVELKIVDTEGNEVGPGDTGEIIAHGPFLMSGYYNNKEETEAYFKNNDDWGWTGDLAKKDADGFISLVGRSKDMIVSGGVNIYPREVEIVLENHEDIIDCAVFGIPDDQWGEALVAFVAAKKPSLLDETKIIDHCTEHLARFKRPKHIRIVKSIPKTPSGKVQKPVLRQEFLERQNAAGSA
ncbi:MAG: long-chain fatty acid--CoA ligase [Rhodospirillaceae bacterium]|nr:long-chain fatty acid--CoA ligase [Rhodospirillaceae bacterium]